MRKLIYLVAGARPNFVKIAPIARTLNKEADRFSHQIIHTGQHHERDTLLGPQPHRAFLNLWNDAAPVLLDSSGLQKELTAVGVPCLTLRHNTAPPLSVDEGPNTLFGTDSAVIFQAAQSVLHHGAKLGHRPALWDGMAAQRIVAHLGECIAK